MVDCPHCFESTHVITRVPKPITLIKAYYNRRPTQRILDARASIRMNTTQSFKETYGYGSHKATLEFLAPHRPHAERLETGKMRLLSVTKGQVLELLQHVLIVSKTTAMHEYNQLHKVEKTRTEKIICI